MIKTDVDPIAVNAPTRTGDPDNQMNDITKGVVSTGQDARMVRFVFVSICCGVARLTNPRIFQQSIAIQNCLGG